jgi:hypothetical protein
MKMMLLAGTAGALLAGAAHAQSNPASPAQAHARLNALVGGSGFYDGWAMHLPSPRTTDFKPGVSVRSDSDCASVFVTPEGGVRFDWRQAESLDSRSSLRAVSPDDPFNRISLSFIEVSFGAAAPTLRLFFRSAADRDSAATAARYLGQRCNPGGFTVET